MLNENLTKRQISTAKYRLTEAYRQSQKRYAQSLKGKAVRHKINTSEKRKLYLKKFRQSHYQKERMKEWHLRWKENGKLGEWTKRSQKRQYILNPEKALARKAVWYAVKIKKLPHVSTLTCACGADAIHYHHKNGYSKENYLNVIPVCFFCHTIIHHPISKLAG